MGDKPRPGQSEKYNERHVAEIIAQACVQPPDGHKNGRLQCLVRN
jgi:putative transposase